MSVKIKLKGGPCDGETHDSVRDTTRRVTRSAKSPGAVYVISDVYCLEGGRRIFTYREPASGDDGAGKCSGTSGATVGPGSGEAERHPS